MISLHSIQQNIWDAFSWDITPRIQRISIFNISWTIQKHFKYFPFQFSMSIPIVPMYFFDGRFNTFLGLCRCSIYVSYFYFYFFSFCHPVTLKLHLLTGDCTCFCLNYYMRRKRILHQRCFCPESSFSDQFLKAFL